MGSIINKLIQDSDKKLKLFNADLAALNLALNLKLSGTIPKVTMFALSTVCMTSLWNTHKGTMRGKQWIGVTSFVRPPKMS